MTLFDSNTLDYISDMDVSDHVLRYVEEMVACGISGMDQFTQLAEMWDTDSVGHRCACVDEEDAMLREGEWFDTDSTDIEDIRAILERHSIEFAEQADEVHDPELSEWVTENLPHINDDDES